MSNSVWKLSPLYIALSPFAEHTPISCVRHRCFGLWSQCALPDLLTPTRAAAAVWTWAPGHPYPSQRWNGSIGQGDARKMELHAFDKDDTVAAVSRRKTLQPGKVQQQSDTADAAETADDAVTLEDERLGGCGVLSGSDGRWRAVTCRAVLPSACRRKGARLSWDEMWTLEGAHEGVVPGGGSLICPATRGRTTF